VITKADTDLVGMDLRDTDQRYRDLSHKVLFQTDLRGARLYGAKVSIECQTFDAVQLDDEQVASLLFMLSLADIDERWKVGMTDMIRAIAGEKMATTLQRYLKLA
jgi:uncharacterized protein YjbI with pentapeptide repeats